MPVMPFLDPSLFADKALTIQQEQLIESGVCPFCMKKTLTKVMESNHFNTSHCKPCQKYFLTKSTIKTEQQLIDEWALGEYDNGDKGCPNCGRSRLCVCANGMHRCEKCNWSPELNTYAPVDY